MSIVESVMATIDNVVLARREDIARLRKVGRQLKAGKNKYRVKLYGMFKPFNEVRLECDNSNLRIAIRNVMDTYHYMTIWQWPQKSRKTIVQGKCGIRMQAFVIDNYGRESVRIYDESLWWHFVETKIRALMRTQPTHRKRG